MHKTSSESAEMYLKTVAELGDGQEPVSLALVAERLEVTTVSVNEMVKRLVEQGFIRGLGNNPGNLGLDEVFTQAMADAVNSRVTNTANITIYAGLGTDPVELGREVEAALQAYMEVGGPIEITVATR